MTQALCRFITCGSVDDGKSTLIGRLLYDSKTLFVDQIHSLHTESKRYGTQGENLDFALLVDGLSSEREQGITIDVAYRFFSTKKRKFIIADTPGHEQYTRNMATGASTADIAIILIDARKGVLTQTKRHSYIVSLLGIRHFFIAVNKMDLIDYDEERFRAICGEYAQILKELREDIVAHYIPISALKGENIVSKSENLAWYRDKTLLEWLEDIELDSIPQSEFVLPVQYVNRPHLNFRAFCGQIASGSVRVGDEVLVLPSMQKSRVAHIITSEITDPHTLTQDQTPQYAHEAYAPMSVSVCLQDERDVSRGDYIVSKNHTLSMGNTFRAMMIWLSETPLELGTTYLLKITHNLCNVRITEIVYKKDMESFTNVCADSLKLNDIAQCTLKLDKTLPLQCYKHSKILGAFIIIDKYSNQTLGAGMIDSVSESIHRDSAPHRIYTDSEIALNAFICEHYPEWGCKKL
ncbi:sulfate adenylyltransferase subunit CysN [uncultured Helicobacter sp.]|uniref:sulfate adenylyltransferase subunit CysN n=1 Tax=uncultured Helicobacter sp. TaxID=175537 RepID=UPI00374F4A48